MDVPLSLLVPHPEKIVKCCFVKSSGQRNGVVVGQNFTVGVGAGQSRGPRLAESHCKLHSENRTFNNEIERIMPKTNLKV